MRADWSSVTAKREDLSRFIVHLTRDTREDFEDGATARKNLLSILKDRRIKARTAHCLHRRKLEQAPAAVRRVFQVTCFTEVPLNQIHLLTQPIARRRIQLESYGLVFEKSFLVQQGAQPALYINGYSGRNATLRDAVDTIFELAVKKKFRGKIWRILPFVNAMHERYDFTWEREWRIAGPLAFRPQDLVCLILPPGGKEPRLRELLAKRGIAVISPGWIYEQIVAELSRQQRSTKRLRREL
jgi:hypothetical protein